jgi:class 3 adenylate cyclase/CheY-like chemotaxis protein
MSITPGHVLVVDDHLTNRLKLSMAVKNLGHTVELAENGLQALELLRAQAFDLVLLDILMPELDGYQVLQQMKQDAQLQTIPVIVISSLEEMESVCACIELGAEDHLPKTFEPALLKARINASIEKKRLRDAVVQQLDFIRRMFGKYVPESVANAIVESGDELQSIRTEASILYSDIEGFTGIVESMPPEQIIQMLNEYFPTVIDPVTRHGGVVNQFQGDAMLVTFNVPLANPQHADHAVQAALEIQQNTRDKTFAGISLRTRIGINTGEVVAGNVGSGERFNYTVHGDAVNLAARLEQLNKDYGTLVLISGNTIDRLSGSYPLVPMGEIAIRGKQQPVSVSRLDV